MVHLNNGIYKVRLKNKQDRPRVCLERAPACITKRKQPSSHILWPWRAPFPLHALWMGRGIGKHHGGGRPTNLCEPGAILVLKISKHKQRWRHIPKVASSRKETFKSSNFGRGIKGRELSLFILYLFVHTSCLIQHFYIDIPWGWGSEIIVLFFILLCLYFSKPNGRLSLPHAKRDFWRLSEASIFSQAEHTCLLL